VIVVALPVPVCVRSATDGAWMLRLTIRHDDGSADASQWAARLRDATRNDMRVVAAFLDRKRLDIFFQPDVDTNVDAAIDRIVAKLGVSDYRASRVVELSVDTADTQIAAVATSRLTSIHRGRIVGVTASPDGCKLSVKVRHKQHEIVDRLETAETENLVEVAVWVGVDADDPRVDYATFADSFTTVTAELDQPVGTRRITYDS
jgi:hypothetical protein